mgnify:CR=1 FL=1
MSKTSIRLTHPWPLSWQNHQVFLGPFMPFLARFSTTKSWPLVSDYDVPDNMNFVLQDDMGQRKRRRLKKELQRQGLSFLDIYVQNIIEKKKILTRQNNWHDFFNMLIWAHFPKSKWALHKAFFASRQEVQSQVLQRSSFEDLLTCFDEGSLLLLCREANYSSLMQALSCRDLSRKNSLLTDFSLKHLVFGHGLLESLCAGKRDLNVLTMLVPLKEEMFSWDLPEIIAKFLDDYLWHNLLKNLKSEQIFSFPVGAVFSR